MQVRGLPLFSWSPSGAVLMPNAARARTCLLRGHAGSTIASVVLANVPALPEDPKTSNSKSASSSSASSSSKATATLSMDEWACSACTFINREPSYRCSICETPRVPQSAGGAAVGSNGSNSAEMRRLRARTILTDLAGTFSRVPGRTVHGAALFHRCPADTPAGAGAPAAAPAAVRSIRVGDRVRMLVSSRFADWDGFLGSRLSFDAGDTVLCLRNCQFFNFCISHSFIARAHLSSGEFGLIFHDVALISIAT
jgi:hypothetical protein